ncbi:response regulator, partial [bacterium]|nr:response regulator [bacterium]
MKQVLIVDDERAFLSILSQGLQGHDQDFPIVTAENGRAAVEVLKRQPVD